MTLLVIISLFVIIAVFSIKSGSTPKSTNTIYYSDEAYRKKYNADQEEKRQRQQRAIEEFPEKLRSPFVKAQTDFVAKYIIIDFETTDLPIDYRLPTLQSIHLYPYPVQAAALVFNEACELIDNYSSIISLPPDARIHPAALKAHGITKAKSFNEGRPIAEFFEFLNKYLRENTCLVSHNIKFDNFILQLEAKRQKIKLPKYAKYCTMEGSKDDVLVFMNDGRRLKNPNLIEMVEHCFFEKGKAPEFERHDALHDAKLCAMCFFKMGMHKHVEFL
ncbi:3'-5' exonuclease [Mucilaginibacter gossypii]|uniref:3'-5' exonuclease n=1 Tax=Mucilaginibacter gossypii TaxID=551996 RepID=UPI000DCE6F43|nr:MULTISPECIES: 3'-5' exonuclease [Mucilaginibacter]QTE38484.1 3'-5' exonuclease [Mucilaginibacter gossypii]RAV59674.1 hypothetical protein DIU36_04340 [Mucilaginibacter rubeus]